MAVNALAFFIIRAASRTDSRAPAPHSYIREGELEPGYDKWGRRANKWMEA